MKTITMKSYKNTSDIFIISQNIQKSKLSLSLSLSLSRKRIGVATAFTIVELLIVVVVIAILAAITATSYNGITKRAATSQYLAAADRVEKAAKIADIDGTMAQAIAQTSFAGISTCLGAIADFPATAEFEEGECAYLMYEGQKYSMRVDTVNVDNLTANLPSLMNIGSLPVARASDGSITWASRGLYLLSWANFFQLQWVAPDRDRSSCGRGAGGFDTSRDAVLQSLLTDLRAVVAGTMTLADFKAKWNDPDMNLQDITLQQVQEAIPVYEALLSPLNGALCVLQYDK